ncbi:MAG: DUF3857 domain-containing protein [Fibrobacterales bacterium]
MAKLLRGTALSLLSSILSLFTASLIFISCAGTAQRSSTFGDMNDPKSDTSVSVTPVTIKTKDATLTPPHELTILKNRGIPFAQYHSTQFGFTLNNQELELFQWTNVSEFAPEVSLGLINEDEDLSFYLMAHKISGTSLRAKQLLIHQLELMNISTASASFKKIEVPYAKEAYSFSIKRVIQTIDFEYRGIFYWDGVRAITLFGWTQGITFPQYQQGIEQLLTSFTPLEKYSEHLTPTEKINSATLMSSIGIHHLKDNEPLIALGYFEKANSLNPTDTLHLLNCAYVYQEKQFFSPGIQHFEEQIETVKKSAKLLSVLAEMYEATKQYEKARQYNALSLELNPVDNEATINLSDVLWAQGQHSQSLVVVKQFYEKQPSSRVGLYLAQTYMGLEHYSQAIELLYQLKEHFGISEKLAGFLVTSLIVQKRYEEALSVTQELAKTQGPSFHSWLFKGKCQYFLKRFRHAQESLKKALALNKDHDEAHSFLAATNGFLGESDLSALKKKIKPVGQTRETSTLLTPTPTSSKNNHAFVHYKSSRLFFKPATKWRHTQEIVVEILDSTGINMYSELIFPFEPGYDYLYVNNLTVMTRKNSRSKQVPFKDFYISNEMDNNAATGSRLAHLPIKGLTIGDVVHVTLTRSSVEKSYEIPFYDHKSSLNIPVHIDQFTVFADTNHLSYEEYGDNSKKVHKGGITWTSTQPKVIRREKFMPHYTEYGTGVRLSHKQSWKDVGSGYLSSIEHQFKSSLGIKEKAFEIQNNSLDTQKVIDDIIEWVRKYIEYQNAPFGGHAIVPRRSIITLNQGYGDCKDQSLLLKEMLDAIGVPSHLVLLNQDGPTSVALPTIQQFNHMILYIPQGDRWREQYIDITDNIGSHRAVPIGLEGKNVLLIDGKQSRLTTTPLLEIEQEHTVRLFHTIVIHKDGSSEFKDSISIDGKFATQIREALFDLSPDSRHRQIIEWLKTDFPDIAINHLEIENLTNFSKPVIMKVIFSTPSYWSIADDSLSGTIPNFWEQSFLKLPIVATRHHPIKLPHHAYFKSTTTIITPEGYTALYKRMYLNNNFTYITLQSSLKEDTPFILNTEWSTYPLYADASEYSAIQKEWRTILDVTAQNVTFVKD